MPGLTFTHPGALLLLGLLAPALLLARRSLAGLTPRRSLLAVTLRLGIMTAIILALAGIQVVKRHGATSVVYVLDRSDSVPEPERRGALAFLNAAREGMRVDDTAGLVVVGRGALVEQTPVAGLQVAAVQSQPDPRFTDLAAGLRLAAATARGDSRRRVVLLSDGNENLGDALAEARRTAALGIAIDVRPLRLPPRGEVLAERLTVPAEMRRGDTFEPRLTIRSDTTTTARLRLLQGNVQVAQMTTPVAPGKSVVALPPVTIHHEGFHHFVVVVEPQADADLRNNRALGFTLVRGRQRVLYVEGDQGQERYLRAALAGSGLELTTVGPAGLPTALPGLVPYDCLILSNVSAVDLSETQLVMIRSAVRDLGMGLVMIGGDQSFGVGGYYQTPVEEALPVDMDVRKLRHLPNVGVAVVIDKSGSMAMTEGGLEKIQLANEAAIALVSLLNPSDQVAVIPTDSEAKPATGPTMMPVAQKQMVVDMIARIRAGGGGIYCYNGLKRAAELLHSASTALKHIILFADAADSEQQERCRELVASLSRRKVTTSVVALGRASDPDVKFLKDIARLGQGRFYLTHQASRLPRIFTREAILASRSQVVEKRFTPRLLTDLEVLKGIAQLPALRGYVATTAKPTAEVGLVTADRHQDPILASWHYGLGRSVAFTSDCKARWAVDWLGWPGYARFWSQVVRWTIRRARRGQFESRVVSGYGSDPDEVEADGPARGEARLLIDAVDEQGRFVNGLRFHGSAVAPDGSGLELDLRQRGPGRYEATFPTHQVGTYLVNVASGEGATQGSQTIGTSLAWPPEYGATRSNEALLQRLAETANGAVLHDPREVFVPKGPPARATRDIWTWLLAFAVALFPLDVAVRRVTIGPRRWQRSPRQAAAPASAHLRQRARAVRARTPRAADSPAAVDREAPGVSDGPGQAIRHLRARRDEQRLDETRREHDEAEPAPPPSPMAPPAGGTISLERDTAGTLARLKRAKRGNLDQEKPDDAR